MTELKQTSFWSIPFKDRLDALKKEVGYTHDMAVKALGSSRAEYFEKVKKIEDMIIAKDEIKSAVISMLCEADMLAPEKSEPISSVIPTPISRWICKKTNELSDDLVCELAEKIGVMPISIVSWGNAERIPNARCLELLFVEIDIPERLMKSYNNELASEIAPENKKVANAQ